MFGSDWPVSLVAGTYNQVFDAVQECLADYSEIDREKLFYANAGKFYRIS
jgi:L-fuconolactonase